MTRLRVGVVGAGIGAAHVEAWSALPDRYEVAVLCDLDPARAAAVAGRFAVPAVTASFDDLLARRPDIVDICTPPALHRAQAVAALAAGCHVVVEKPAACSLAEIDAIAAAEAASGRSVCPIFQYRFGNGFARLQHLIGKGLAGRPALATAETHWHRDAAYYAAAPWRGTIAGELGGCLASHAIHVHDMLCEVLGPLASVHARTSSRLKRNETEDTAVLSLAFASGAFATSSVTLSSRQEILRGCASSSRTSSPKAASRPTSPAATPGASSRTTRWAGPASPGPSPTSPRSPSASRASSCGSTTP